MLLGWLNIYAAVFSEEHDSIFDITQRYGAQLVWIGAALLIAFVILITDSRFYQVFAFYIYAVIILLLVLVLFFGVEVNASRSWFVLGGFRMQPSEFAKFATALALARSMSVFGFSFNSFRSCLRVGFLLFLPVALILLQNDMGSAFVFSAFIWMLYRAGLNSWLMLLLGLLVLLFIMELLFDKAFIIIGLFLITMVLFAVFERRLRDTLRFTLGLLGLGAIIYGFSEFFGINIPIYRMALILLGVGIPIALIYAYINKLKSILVLVAFLFATSAFSFSVDYIFHNVLLSHHRDRINDLLGIESDPLGWGYNVSQSKIAIGSGGFWGKGYLNGTQTKFNFVPEQSTDFIFCTIGEEWGFVGAFVVVSLFVALLLRLIHIAERQRTEFAQLYGYGVVSIIFFHTAINIAMTVGLFPVIGIPLPFFSYGGSSLWAFTILLFILLKLDSARMD